MTQVTLTESCAIDITLSPPASIEAFFIFGLHKCGSSLLNKVFVDICKALNLPCIAIPELAFKQGISNNIWNNSEILNSVIKDGYCYRGFRNYPDFLTSNKLISDRKKILLVRDPRDALVSAYYSFTKSHPQPGQGQALKEFLELKEKMEAMNIEKYVIDSANKVKNDFQRYTNFLTNDKLLKTYRYEDIIFEKLDWINDMLAFLDLSLESDIVEEIARKNDIVPSAENVNQHIRKVKPGDHKEKLSPECIARINEILSEVLEHYNYLD